MNKSISLQNTDGFWELIFDGEHAVLKQDQGLFYVAWLLARPSSEPLSARMLAREVYEAFGAHPDFQDDLPWIENERDLALAAKYLLRRQDQLESIIRDPRECEPANREAWREFERIEEHQLRLAEAQIAEDRQLEEAVARAVCRLTLSLLRAVDARGNPHRVARAFGLHLLLYIVMPSVRKGGFVYEPHAECGQPCASLLIWSLTLSATLSVRVANPPAAPIARRISQGEVAARGH